MTETRPATNEASSKNGEAVDNYGILGRVLRSLAPLDIPAKDLFEDYLRHKWRVNHKPRTIESSFTSVMLFLEFRRKAGKSDITALQRDDLDRDSP